MRQSNRPVTVTDEVTPEAAERDTRSTPNATTTPGAIFRATLGDPKPGQLTTDSR